MIASQAYPLQVECQREDQSAFRSDDANAQPGHLQAATLGAKASFIFGTAFMIFSETRWWPVMFSIAALVTWILSGWIVALLGYSLTARLRRQ